MRAFTSAKMGCSKGWFLLLLSCHHPAISADKGGASPGHGSGWMKLAASGLHLRLRLSRLEKNQLDTKKAKPSTGLKPPSFSPV